MLLRKSIGLDSAEFKFDEARKGFFCGYASVFGGVDSYKDTIAPGAYIKTLQDRARPVQMRWNHHGPVIGKWLTLREDEKGLYVEGELTPGHSQADDTYALMKHGAVTGLSIGYRVGKSAEKSGGIRELQEIDLIEISVVEQPADLAAQIGDVKSALDGAQSLKELEALLRDVGGFSHAEAKALIAKAKALGEPREAVPEVSADDAKQLLAIRAQLFKSTT